MILLKAMMKNGKTNCPFKDEIVSYIYDEIVGSERLNFESHLSGCSVCTDEFAAISEARFSVFEWQKEEFGNLPTPNIVIPYEPKKNTVKEGASVGLLAGLRGWLQPLPIAAAAALIVIVGLSFVMFRSVGPREQTVASNLNVQPVAIQNAEPIKNAETVKQPEITQAEVAVTTPKTTSKDIQPIKIVARRQTAVVKQMVATTPKKQNLSPALSTAPVLSNYEAEDDNSLRLADLFADIDG